MVDNFEYIHQNKEKIEDIKEKMKVAAWIKAADAKSFGIVDEIIDAMKTSGHLIKIR